MSNFKSLNSIAIGLSIIASANLSFAEAIKVKGKGLFDAQDQCSKKLLENVIQSGEFKDLKISAIVSNSWSMFRSRSDSWGSYSYTANDKDSNQFNGTIIVAYTYPKPELEKRTGELLDPTDVNIVQCSLKECEESFTLANVKNQIIQNLYGSCSRSNDC